LVEPCGVVFVLAGSGCGYIGYKKSWQQEECGGRETGEQELRGNG